MTIIKSIFSTTLLTLIVTAGTAQAAGNMGGGRGPGPMSFSDFDKNGDGMISREEFTATQQNRVETQTQTRSQTREMNSTPATPPMTAPATGMGMGMQQQNQQQMQEQMQNQSQEQMQEQMQQQTQQRMRAADMPAFGDYDLDSDGNVTEKEFYTARNNRIRQRVLEGKPMRNMSNAPSFSSIDSNGDKQLSEEEFNKHQDEHMKMWKE